MFKKSFLLVLGILSILLVTMAVSRPFANESAPGREGANDFYQRHRNWNRDLEGSDYYERHPNRSAAAIVDLTGDFALRHPDWTLRTSNAIIPVTGIFESFDYFQRHPELRTPETIDLSDYFQRH